MKKLRRVMRFMIILCLVLMGLISIMEGKRKEADASADWNLILVNDDYLVPENYEVELWTLKNGEQIDARIYPYLQEMFDAARDEDVHMVVADGYRSMEEQQATMNEKVKEYKQRVYVSIIAEKMAEKWVAVPGTSEHQLGLAVDINADVQNYGWEVYGWLVKHAHEYGFIQRYPEDKTKITGISYEPWHYRYVGIEAATEMYEKNLCLEEYIDSLK